MNDIQIDNGVHITRTSKKHKSKPLVIREEVSRFQYHLHLVSTIMIVLFGWSIVIFMGFAEWPGRMEKHDCVTNYLTESACFCEKPRPNWIIKQPANTISNLAYAASALLCAWIADRRTFPRNKAEVWFCSKVNLMIEHRYFSISFCLILANISHCSALYHGGWMLEGQILDQISLYAMFFWLMYFALIRLALVYFGWDPRNIAAAAKIHALLMIITITAISTMFFLTTNSPSVVLTMLYYVPTGVAFLCEVILQCIYRRLRHKRVERETSQLYILFLAILCLIVGFSCQRLSKPGSKMCNSESFFQGHSLWHGLSALSIALVYIYLGSEKPIVHATYDLEDSQTTDSEITEVRQLDIESQFGALETPSTSLVETESQSSCCISTEMEDVQQCEFVETESQVKTKVGDEDVQQLDIESPLDLSIAIPSDPHGLLDARASISSLRGRGTTSEKNTIQN